MSNGTDTASEALKELMEAFDLDKPNEELHPDLKFCLSANKLGLQTIGHPLIHDVFYTPQLNALTNKRYLMKRKLYDEEIAKGNWNVIDYLIEKPYRIEVLMRHFEDIPPPQWWPLVRKVWTGVENLWQYKSYLPMLFRGQAHTIREIFTDDDWEAYEKWPREITVFRGCQYRNARGWSWTLSYGVAAWFAKRWCKENQAHYVLTATIEKSNVLFYYNGRKEQEIVIRPDCVKRISSKRRI